METINNLGTYTFPSLLKNSLKKFADRNALSLVGETPITYKQLYEKSLQFARILTGFNLKKGNKVAIYATGRPEWGAAYLGIVNQGIIAVPLLPDFSSVEVESIIAHCGVDALVVEQKLYEKIKDIKNSLPPVIIRMEDYKVIKGAEKITGNNEEIPPECFENIELDKVDVFEDDTASIIYTSGTTGRSKGVELTHRNLVWNAVQCQSVHRVNKMDRCLSFLPISHVYEFTIGFTMQIMNGSCIYYLGKPPVVSALLPALKLVQPTIVCSVPLVAEKIYKNKVLPTFNKNPITKFLFKISPTRKILSRIAGKELKKTFGKHLVFFGIGGAKVDPQVERFLREAKFPYAIGYGLTETSPLLAGSSPRTTKLGTIGYVMEGVDMMIANPDSETGIGEVVARSRGIMKGYYKEPELTKNAFTTEEDSVGEGWFKTGDLGILKPERGKLRLSLKGRNKNMILGPSGENIYPEDIEFVLNQHPLVSESLIVEDDKGLVALVQLEAEKFENEAEERTGKKFPGINIKEIVQGISQAVTEKQEEIIRDIAYQKESILSEVQFFVNSRVNKNSMVGKVQRVTQFEKTASQKIKRYLYDLRTKVSGNKTKNSREDEDSKTKE